MLDVLEEFEKGAEDQFSRDGERVKGGQANE
jgi:hypothetical protein